MTIQSMLVSQTGLITIRAVLSLVNVNDHREMGRSIGDMKGPSGSRTALNVLRLSGTP
jgi:hypothetical protein